MIDDEGNSIGLVAPVDSGRCGAIGESHSSTTAAPPAAGRTPRRGQPWSPPPDAVAARRFRRGAGPGARPRAVENRLERLQALIANRVRGT